MTFHANDDIKKSIDDKEKPLLDTKNAAEQIEQINDRSLLLPSPNDSQLNSTLAGTSINGNNPNNSRPKLYTMRSSETSRFPTLEKLQNSNLLSKRSSKIIVEPIVFPNNHTYLDSNNSTSPKKGSQSDEKSNNKKKKQQPRVKKARQSTPTEIFARNLNEAVLDVDDSLDKGYVYSSNSNLYSPPIIDSNSDSYFSDHQKYRRRPGLRSTVSELLSTGVKPFYLDSISYYKGFHHSLATAPSDRKYQYQYSSSGEEDEENAPLLYHSSSSRSNRHGWNNRRKKSTNKVQQTKVSRISWMNWLCVLFLSILLVLCGSLLLTSGPLEAVEIVSISNVLGTQKQLIFDMHVTARNVNGWSIQMSRSAFSVFAASHYVPTLTNVSAAGRDEGGKMLRRSSRRQQEYLGTVEKLDDPLLFKPAFLHFLKPVSSNSTSQIQIKNPGETIDDKTGNERWSSLIRYPYEITVRGVLKYQVFPFNTKFYSSRICKMIQFDPVTGIVKEVPFVEQSICEE